MYPPRLSNFFLHTHFLNICTFWLFHPTFFNVISQNAHKNRWMVVSTVVLLQEGPRFEPRQGPGGRSFCVEFVCSPCVSVGTRFPPTAQRHAG